jgi:hypothetical protein
VSPQLDGRQGRRNGGEKLLYIQFGNLGLLERVSYTGVCKKWSDSNTTCNRTFPPNLDVLTVVLQDLNLPINATLLADTTYGARGSFSSLSQAASALIITSILWTVLIFGLVQALPTKFQVQILPLVVFLTMSISAWVIYNSIFYTQLHSSAQTPAVVGGAGFWVFLVYVVCTLLITPVTSFWVLIACLFLIVCFFIFLWLCFICFMIMLACFLGGGETEQERREREGYP